jgi:hypothetical protein
MEMANMSGIVKQLKKERDRVKKQLLELDAALTAFARETLIKLSAFHNRSS